MSGEVILRHVEPVMGTVISFDLRPRGLGIPRARAALAAACELLHRADAVFSLYRPESPTSRLRRGELAVAQCPPEVASVLRLCEQARRSSGGWFDPWAMPGGVDPTGLVKGWAAAQAARHLREAGVGAGLVNAAGDIDVFGAPTPDESWRIGIQSPTDRDALLGAIDVDHAIATSGGYERDDHVRDPRTGAPARGALSATVLGPDLSFADAFATGLLAAGEQGLAAVREAGYEALLVLPDGRLTRTPGIRLAA